MLVLTYMRLHIPQETVALLFGAALLKLPWRRVRQGLLVLLLAFGLLQFLVLSYEPVNQVLVPKIFNLPFWGRTSSLAQGTYIQLPDDGKTDRGYWIHPDVLQRMEEHRLALGREWLSLGLLATAIVATTALLDMLGISISGLNAGPGGAFPLVAFSAVGATAALLHQRAGLRGLVVATPLSAALSGAAWLSGQPWVVEHVSVYNATAAPGSAQALGGLLGIAPTATVGVRFWNHSALGALGLLLPLCLSLLLFLGPQHSALPGRLLRPLELLGRHALAVYVAHLIVLGLLDLLGLRPQSALWTWGLIAALTGGAVAAAAARHAVADQWSARATAPPPNPDATFCKDG